MAALASVTEIVKALYATGSDRKAFWEQVFRGPIAEQAYANNIEESERLLENKLESVEELCTGEVYLVGGGPGDPDLLTFKALRLMQQADIVLYDRLVSKEVLNLVRSDATRIYVGKTAGDHPVTQDNINQKLVDYVSKAIVAAALREETRLFWAWGRGARDSGGKQYPFSGCTRYNRSFWLC